MSGFRLKLNRLKNISFLSSSTANARPESSFETEYFFEGFWSWVSVKPIVINGVVIFLVHFIHADREPVALVYNERETWSDIEKESTPLTAIIGAAIERHYSSCSLPLVNGQEEVQTRLTDNNHHLN